MFHLYSSFLDMDKLLISLLLLILLIIISTKFNFAGRMHIHSLTFCSTASLILFFFFLWHNITIHADTGRTEVKKCPTPLKNEYKITIQIHTKYKRIPEWIRLVFRLESLYNLQLLIWFASRVQILSCQKHFWDIHPSSVFFSLSVLNVKCRHTMKKYSFSFFLHYKSVKMNQNSVSCLCRKFNCKLLYRSQLNQS